MYYIPLQYPLVGCPVSIYRPPWMWLKALFHVLGPSLRQETSPSLAKWFRVTVLVHIGRKKRQMLFKAPGRETNGPSLLLIWLAVKTAFNITSSMHSCKCESHEVYDDHKRSFFSKSPFWSLMLIVHEMCSVLTKV